MVFKAPMHAQASGIKSTFVWSRIWLFTYVIDNLNKKYDGDEGFVLGEKNRVNKDIWNIECEFTKFLIPLWIWTLCSTKIWSSPRCR